MDRWLGGLLVIWVWGGYGYGYGYTMGYIVGWLYGYMAIRCAQQAPKG